MEHFPALCLQHRFSTNVGTYLSEELSYYFLDGVVADGGQATFRAAECMADIEGLATWAVRGKSSFSIED